MKYFLLTALMIAGLSLTSIAAKADAYDNDGGTPVWSSQSNLPAWAAKAYENGEGE